MFFFLYIRGGFQRFIRRMALPTAWCVALELGYSEEVIKIVTHCEEKISAGALIERLLDYEEGVPVKKVKKVSFGSVSCKMGETITMYQSIEAREERVRLENETRTLLREIRCIMCGSTEKLLELFIPCGHCVVCEECYETNWLMQCLLCSIDIGRAVLVYRA